MKLTRDRLKQIIKEELEEMMGEVSTTPANELFQLMKSFSSQGKSLSAFVDMVQNIQAGGTPTKDTAAIEKIKSILPKLPQEVLDPDGRVNRNALFDLIQREVDMEHDEFKRSNPNRGKTVYENKKKSK